VSCRFFYVSYRFFYVSCRFFYVSCRFFYYFRVSASIGIIDVENINSSVFYLFDVQYTFGCQT